MSFSSLIGNIKTKEMLIESAKKQNVLHSYLFYGTDGIGKKLFAIEFAKLIMCEFHKEECNSCKSCVEFLSHNNPDFMLIEPDGNAIKIDQIREFQKKIIEKPINGRKKVYIINDGDKMTKEAQNCLLKTLEEPQEYVVIILICSNENVILPTVKSRCTKICFNNLSKEEIREFIKEKNTAVTLDDNMLELCGGSLNKALEIVDKSDIFLKVDNIISNVNLVNKLEFMSNSVFFMDNKENIYSILEYMYVLLSKKINSVTLKQCANAMEYVEQAKKKLLYSNNYDMTIDGMLIKIWEEFNEKNNWS